MAHPISHNTVEETLNRSRLLTSALRASRMHAGGHWGGHGLGHGFGHGYGAHFAQHTGQGFPQHFGTHGYQVPTTTHMEPTTWGNTHHQGFGGYPNMHWATAPTLGTTGQHVDLETKNTDGTTTTTHLGGGNNHWGGAGFSQFGHLDRSGLFAGNGLAWTGAHQGQHFGGGQHWPQFGGQWAGHGGHGFDWRNHGGFTGSHFGGSGHWPTQGFQTHGGHHFGGLTTTAPHVDYVQSAPTITHTVKPTTHTAEPHIDVLPQTTGLNYASHWGGHGAPQQWGAWGGHGQGRFGHGFGFGHGLEHQQVQYVPQTTGHHPWFSGHTTAPQHVDFVKTTVQEPVHMTTVPTTHGFQHGNYTTLGTRGHLYGSHMPQQFVMPQTQHVDVTGVNRMGQFGHFGGHGAHGGYGIHQTAPFQYTAGHFGHGGLYGGHGGFGPHMDMVSRGPGAHGKTFFQGPDGPVEVVSDLVEVNPDSGDAE